MFIFKINCREITFTHLVLDVTLVNLCVQQFYYVTFLIVFTGRDHSTAAGDILGPGSFTRCYVVEHTHTRVFHYSYNLKVSFWVKNLKKIYTCSEMVSAELKVKKTSASLTTSSWKEELPVLKSVSFCSPRSLLSVWVSTFQKTLLPMINLWNMDEELNYATVAFKTNAVANPGEW